MDCQIHRRFQPPRGIASGGLADRPHLMIQFRLIARLLLPCGKEAVDDLAPTGKRGDLQQLIRQDVRRKQGFRFIRLQTGGFPLSHDKPVNGVLAIAQRVRCLEHPGIITRII